MKESDIAKETNQVSSRGKEPETLEKGLMDVFHTNVVSYAHLVNAFMPLILAGRAKKIAILSSGLGDADMTREYDLWFGVSYSVSKAALNMIIAKFSAEYREKGVLILGISPGVVDTSPNQTGSESILWFLKFQYEF